MGGCDYMQDFHRLVLWAVSSYQPHLGFCLNLGHELPICGDLFMLLDNIECYVLIVEPSYNANTKI